jgi:heat shock protein HslJ
MVDFRHVACGAASLLILLAIPGPAHSASGGAGATNWVLQRGRDIPARPSRRPQLRMEGQKLSGSTGCNAFTATISEKAEKRVAIEQVAVTRMLCAPDRNKVEAAFVRALKATEYVEEKGTQLVFLSGARQPLLEWTREEKSGARSAPRKRHMQAQSRRRAAVARNDRRRAPFARRAEGCWGWWTTAPAKRRARML